jgi:hypothetical protein
MNGRQITYKVKNTEYYGVAPGMILRNSSAALGVVRNSQTENMTKLALGWSVSPLPNRRQGDVTQVKELCQVHPI